MKLLVIGHARHGKDTVGEMLDYYYGLEATCSSLFLAERVVRPALEAKGIVYADLDECYRDRVNHRAAWFDAIAAFNSDDPSRTTREILERADVYVGMRSPIEYEASRRFFDHVLWVDSSDRGIPPEPASSFGIAFDPETMTMIRNDGSLDDLRDRIYDFIQTTTWPR